MKRPSITDQGKSKPWWVLLHEYEVYLSLVEKYLRVYRPDVLRRVQDWVAEKAE